MQPHLLPDDVPVDPVDEQLVAYLDGELDPLERDALEQRLVDDPVLRERLQQLQGGWEMLDELPQSSVREQFTETTLELVAADASREVQVKQARRWRRQWTLPTIAALLSLVTIAGGAGGVFLVRYWNLQQQLVDLPVAQHLDAYRYADDLDFMRNLMDDAEWKTHVDAAIKLRQMRFPSPDLRAVPVSQRDEVLDELGIRDRERLASKWQEFDRLSEPQRERIRNLARQVHADPREDELLQTMDAYARWFQSLDTETQSALRESSGQQRETVMRQAMERSRREWISRSGPLLSPDDVDAIYDVVHTAASDWVEMIRTDDEAISPFHRNFLKRRLEDYAALNQPTPEAAVLNYVFVVRGPWRLGYATEPRPPFNTLSLREAFRLSDYDYEALPWILSDDAQETLHAMPTAESQRELLDQWIYEAVLRTTGDGRETLPRSERLMAMDPEQREELELSPPSVIFGRLDRGPRGFGPPPRIIGRTFRPGGPPLPGDLEPDEAAELLESADSEAEDAEAGNEGITD